MANIELLRLVHGGIIKFLHGLGIVVHLRWPILILTLDSRYPARTHGAEAPSRMLSLPVAIPSHE
jgi:hypothetical protein